MQGLQGYAAVVTGGAQGIGKAISAALAGAGMHVVMLDPDRQAGREAAKELSRSTTVQAIAGDAADETAVRSAVAAALKLGKGLRAAVANAGISLNKPVTRLRLEEWNRVLAVNLGGGFLLAKHAAAGLKRREGAMVLIGSSRALMSEPDWEAYGASKGGVVALSHALAISLGPRVRVNCVSPAGSRPGTGSARASAASRGTARKTTRSTRRGASARRRMWRGWCASCFPTRPVSSPARTTWSTAA